MPDLTTHTSAKPPQQLANGVVYAFVHTVEQYSTSTPSTPLVQDRLPKASCTIADRGGLRLPTAPELV